MDVVSITKNGKLQKDDEGQYWLLLESSAGSAAISLSTFVTDSITGGEKTIGFDDVLETFMNDQKTPATGSPN